MEEDKDIKRPVKAVRTTSIDSSRPPPGNEETMAENIQQSRIDAAEDLTHTKTNQSEAEPVYPPLKKLIPTILALYLSFFLVALVCHYPLRLLFFHSEA